MESYDKIRPMSVTKFEGVTPILPVKNLKASLRYYVGKLGFKIDWQQKGAFASVSRDRCGLFLCEGDQGRNPTWAWVGVEDVAALFREYRRKRARIRHAPTNYYWAREMQVEDLDGNVLRLGSEPTDEPFGEWLDMQGFAWSKTADGKWRRAKRVRR
jgi:catechol 2,3-dioxygenase-like lactoylglutathione lyase family enzyme